MSIEYRPPSLERIVNDPIFGPKRLKNREGIVYLVSDDGMKQQISEGYILDVNAEAILFHSQFPDQNIVVEEYSCNSLVIPNELNS
jgi:hypothetical protein